MDMLPRGITSGTAAGGTEDTEANTSAAPQAAAAHSTRSVDLPLITTVKPNASAC